MSIYTDVLEIECKRTLDVLFKEWIDQLEATNIAESIKSTFIPDGFYPGYLSQRVRVLFIGRESLGIDLDYNKCLFMAYKNGRVGGIPGKHLNAHKTHYLQFYIAYGFNHGFVPWKDIPRAFDLAKGMGIAGGISFAAINVSKFSNWGNSWRLDRKLVRESLNVSRSGGFLIRQIEILRPDVICSMNALSMASEQLGPHDYIDTLSSRDIDVYDYHYNDGVIVPFLDMWHFAAPRKSSFAHYYEPLVHVFPKLCERYHTLHRN